MNYCLTKVEVKWLFIMTVYAPFTPVSLQLYEIVMVSPCDEIIPIGEK